MMLTSRKVLAGLAQMTSVNDALANFATCSSLVNQAKAMMEAWRSNTSFSQPSCEKDLWYAIAEGVADHPVDFFDIRWTPAHLAVRLGLSRSGQGPRQQGPCRGQAAHQTAPGAV